MSMQITNNYNNYNTGYTAAAEKKQAAQSQAAEQTGKSSGAAKTAKDKVAEYYSSLQEEYDCVKNGSIAISGKYLKECANDPTKAKALEDDLAFYKQSCESGRKSAEANARSLGARLVSYNETWSYDSKGNLTVIAQTTIESEGGGKSAKELQEEREEKLKEKKEKERLEEKREEKKEFEEKLLEKEMEKTDVAVETTVTAELDSDVYTKSEESNITGGTVDIRA